MKKALISTIIVTLFRLSWLAIIFASQIIVAGLFGAALEMDAYVAANTLPLYIITVLTGALGFVFIPAFVQYKARGLDEEAWALASNVINFCMIILGIVTVCGMIFAYPLLRLVTPGLSELAMEIGVRVAIIAWPSVLLTAMVILLSSIYQAQRKFAWQAAVPAIGGLVSLVLIMVLSKRFGAVGLALATTAGAFVQVCLLLKIIAGPGKYRPVLNWRDPGIQQLFRLFLPLVLVSFFTKFTPLVERYLASELREGSISHINYAFRIIGIASLLIAGGISTVVFPRMSEDASKTDNIDLKDTMSLSLRMMWLLIAPVIAIGLSLCLPMVKLFFEHGQFGPADSLAVSGLLQIYLLALVGMCLGNITGRGFYVLKDTRTIALYGIVEAFAYVYYAIMLTRWMGLLGLVISYAIYMNVSLAWQLIVLRFKMGNFGGLNITKSFIRIGVAALGAAIVTHIIRINVAAPSMQLIAGSIAGAAIYVTVLHLAGSDETKLIISQLRKI